MKFYFIVSSSRHRKGFYPNCASDDGPNQAYHVCMHSLLVCKMKIMAFELQDWKIGPTILTLCEHLFVSFMIRGLRKQAGKVTTKIRLKEKLEVIDGKPIAAAAEAESVGQEQKGKGKIIWRLGIGRFILSGIIAYLDGRLCRCIPNPIARRIVSGFLLTFLDQNDQ